MAAWPQFVPRIELDIHLKTIDERLADLTNRLGGHQEQQARSLSDVDHLHGWCKELASKVEVNSLGSRLDLQISCVDSSVTEGLQEMREYSQSEVQRLREELQAPIDALKLGLSTATTEIARLDGALRKAIASNETTFATKADQSLLRTELDRSREVMYSTLVSEIHNIDLDKASRAQLDEARSALRSSDERLAKDLAAVSASLSQTAQSLATLDRECHSVFSTKAALHEVSGTVSELLQRTSQSVEDRLDLRSSLECERERIRENIVEVQESWRLLNEAADDIHHLKVGRSLLNERCEKHERELQMMSEVEKKHWEDCQEALAAQQSVDAKLQGSCADLRKELHQFIGVARQESEQLRQHSTIRYLDQLDKAMNLQETVDQVQKGHQALNETMRTIKLPKV